MFAGTSHVRFVYVRIPRRTAVDTNNRRRVAKKKGEAAQKFKSNIYENKIIEKEMQILSAVLVAFIVIQAGSEGKTDNNTFVATDEWQEVREGQSVPPGLHVRINLQTGKKEAKLLDNESKGRSTESGEGALVTLPDNASQTTPKGAAKHKKKISRPLSEALKKLPKDALRADYSPEKLRKIKRDFKTYEELKASYDDMRKSFKTDAEIITQLLNEFRNLSRKSESEPTPTLKTKVRAQLRILENFDYLVHQYDNALWFIDQGGLERVLLPLVVNETHVELRVGAMRVLGALTQNNPKAQIKVFERNFGSHLSQILISSTNTEELSAALYAFGSLLRKFPHAQQRILSTLGTQALIAVLGKECELKNKAKAATLISDMIVEKQLVTVSSAKSDPLVVAQYAELKFPDWLKVNSYCDIMDTLISTRLYDLLELPDLMEYFVQTLEHTKFICVSFWSQSAQLRHSLLTLKSRYLQSQEEYRMEVAHSITDLFNNLYKEAGPHDEL